MTRLARPARARLRAAAATVALVAGAGGALATRPPVPAPAPACKPGIWTATAPDPAAKGDAALPVRYETAHLAFRWKGDLVSPAVAKAAGDYLEYVWGYFVGTIGFPEPDCATADKHKANIAVAADFGLTGGVDDAGHIGMWIGPGGLRDRFGLAHELTHALQGGTGALRDTIYGGWLWESHANWMTVQLPEFRDNTHCSMLSVDHPHLYYGSTRVRYCNWQFLEYLKDRFGYAAVNDIWRRAPRHGAAGAAVADPLLVLMRNRRWTVAGMNDVFGDWAMHNAGWDYTNPDGGDQGAIYRRAYGPYETVSPAHPLRTTLLDPMPAPGDVAARRFAVPAAWAPQRWGYNLVRLRADAGATAVTVSFRGIVQPAPAATTLPGLRDEPATIPPPASDWRWGLVAVDRDGRSRYGPLRRGAAGTATIAIRPDDRGLFLTVTATPRVAQSIRWDQAYYTIYRYPWMAEFHGALPDGHQPAAPPPTADGHRHPNGGGWVAAGASVDAGAYVGPYARVLAGTVGDRARIEDHAIVAGGQVLGDARASALTIVRAGTILKDHARAATSFAALGDYEKGVTLSGTAQVIGDVEERGTPLSAGVRYGFIDGETVADRMRGPLAAPVAEITAPPDYVWRR